MSRNLTVFSATRVFDGEQILPEHAVMVENGMVTAVVPRSTLPEGLPLRHTSGGTLLPGLIDTHVHFMRWEGAQYLAYGVTTVRDTGNDLEWILARRDEWEQQLWPRILCAGPLLDGPTPIHKIVARGCADAQDAINAVRETAAAGVDAIKLYVGLQPDWLPGMVQAGHCAGRKVSMHCLASGVLIPAQAGIDEFFHLDGILADVWPTHPAGWLEIWGLPEFARTRERQREVASSLRDLGITATPTLAYWDSQWRVRTSGYPGSEELRHVPPFMVEMQGTLPEDPASSAQWRSALQAAQQFTSLLIERGVPLLAGTDVPCGAVPPGLSLWRELSLLVEAGLSPQQALCAATSAAASFLRQATLGHLRPGSTADMVMIKGNPLDHIPEKPDIAWVMRRGIVYQPGELLAAAQTAIATVQTEPWGVQFALHHK